MCEKCIEKVLNLVDPYSVEVMDEIGRQLIEAGLGDATDALAFLGLTVMISPNQETMMKLINQTLKELTAISYALKILEKSQERKLEELDISREEFDEQVDKIKEDLVLKAKHEFEEVE